MKLEDVVRNLQIPDSIEALRPNWDAGQASMPGEIPFLDAGFVRDACAAAHLPDEMTEAVATAALRIARDKAACSLLWHGRYLLAQSAGQRVALQNWPTLTAALGREAGMFYVLLLLSGTPEMREVHRTRGIPPDVVRDTTLDLKLCMSVEDYTDDHGYWGISPRIMNWLLLHWRGELYRLGRLQFVPSTCRARLRAFRHGATATVLALSEGNVTYRSDGQLDGAGGIRDASGAWVSHLDVTEKQAQGHPILPLGHCLKTPVRLPLDEWRQELAPGDPVLDIHIPAGAPMTHEECGHSIRRALEFFPRHFPDKPFAALMCNSWILDAQFERLLPPTSNLVRFQQEMYLYPIQGSHEGTLRHVFGRKMKDLQSAPRGTTMQRAFARHVEEGGHFRGGGCFLLPKDFRWGSRVYRSREQQLASFAASGAGP